MKVVIVGGVAGGASAPRRIRRLDEHAQIHHDPSAAASISYAKCGLPYYVGSVIRAEKNDTANSGELLGGLALR